MTLTDVDAMEYLGPKGFERFKVNVQSQRLGQAWFNSLPADDAARLVGSLADPFYADDWSSVLTALEYLLS